MMLIDDAHERSGNQSGSEHRHQAKCALGEIKGTHQHRRPGEPISRGRGRHRQEAETLGPRSEHDATADEGEPHRENNNEIGEHDFLEQRRPVEREKGPDTAGGEHSDDAEPVAQAPRNRSQAIFDRLDRKSGYSAAQPGVPRQNKASARAPSTAKAASGPKRPRAPRSSNSRIRVA